MITDYEFVITTPIDVVESLGPNKIRAGGTFIRLEVPTKNGRIYQVQEAEQIIKDLKGKAVYIHADPTGDHINKDKNLVGKVTDVLVDKAGKIIKGFVEIWNTPNFPNLISRIKKGWGFSIGGVVQKFLPTGKINERMMPIVHAIGMRANHLQLLEPQEKRGDPTAQVEELIPVMESLQLNPDPFTAIDTGDDNTRVTTENSLGDFYVPEGDGGDSDESDEPEKPPKTKWTEIHKRDEFTIIYIR